MTKMLGGHALRLTGVELLPNLCETSVCMVTKQPDGMGGFNRLTVNPAYPSKRGKFDPWPSHAVSTTPGDVLSCDGTNWYFLVTFELKDGHTYEYRTPCVWTSQQAHDFSTAWECFPDTIGRLGFYGEWWNRFGKAFIREKVLVS